jgi:hypothetical protein
MIRALSVSILALACACAAPPAPRVPAPVVNIHRTAAPAPVARPEAALVQDLDRGIQARFKDVRPSDIAVGRLGASRVGGLDGLRRGLLHQELREEQQTIRELSFSGWDSAIYVVEGLSRNRAGEVTGPIVDREETWSRFQASYGIRELAARAMASKSSERGAAAGVSLEARVVLASETSCLRCHRRNQVGDSLGAVVYAFRPQPLLSDAGR